MLAARAEAADTAGPLTQAQVSATCPAWNEAQLSSPVRTSQLSLLFDYIVAHDREPERDYYAGHIDLTDGVDAAEVAVWMTNYCAANPRDGFEQTAAALVRELEARWINRKNGR